MSEIENENDDGDLAEIITTDRDLILMLLAALDVVTNPTMAAKIEEAGGVATFTFQNRADGSLNGPHTVWDIMSFAAAWITAGDDAQVALARAMKGARMQ